MTTVNDLSNIKLYDNSDIMKKLIEIEDRVKSLESSISRIMDEILPKPSIESYPEDMYSGWITPPQS